MRSLISFFIFAVLMSVFCVADEGHKHELTKEQLGTVHFTTSCQAQVQATFDRAVALLHSFGYEESRKAFSQVAAEDSQCAMAYWGIAMTHYHGVWGTGDSKSGGEAVKKAQTVAAENPHTTAREKAYIDAIAQVYDESGKAGGLAYEKKMESLHHDFPDDSEAAIFYALALDVTAPKTDKTFSNQRKCGEILEPIFKQQPNHPGVAHYLIHCYDNPVLAPNGLVAARAYAKIAASSAHAQHMPSHIFTRVGSWEEAKVSNIASAESARRAEQTSTNGEARDQRLHALDYLEYAYLQSGSVKEAAEIVDQVRALQRVKGLTITGNYATEAIPARFDLELGRWKQASELKPDASASPQAQAITWMAIGIGSARSGNVARADEAEQKLAAIRDQLKAQENTYWSDQVEVQRREVAAWMAEQNGRKQEAVDVMRSAAELEESMDKGAVTPGAITPAREMLGQLLLAHDQPREALQEFEAVLKVAPNRFNALYGAAKAADMAHENARAHEYFGALLKVCQNRTERGEVKTASDFLSSKGQ